MCVVYAIISFDFRVAVAIHLLRSHIAVSGTQCNVGNEKSNSQIKIALGRTRRGLFFYPNPTIRISPVGARGKLHTRVCWIGQLPLCGAGYFVFHGGRLFLFFSLGFFLTCFFSLSFLLKLSNF
jgi:hypothetical protein